MNIESLYAMARSRARLALSSARGAFDLPSIITGVVVVGILTAGVFAAVFGVIPFAQDRGAKQDLGAVRTAEGVSKAKDSKYTDAVGLRAAGYLPSVTNLAIGADSAGSCWVGLAKSGSGNVYYSTTAKTDPQIFTSGTDTGCLSAAEQAALAASLGVEATAAPQGPNEAVSIASWGDNWYGQFVNGKTSDWSLEPVQGFTEGVMAGKTVTLMSAGSGYECAVADGDLYCWGDNWYGNTGTGSTGEVSTPTLVTGAVAGKTITALSAGFAHACAVADGDLYCWGANLHGKLGNGDTEHSSVPVPVTGALAGKTVTSVAAGGQFTCATSDGSVYCWGQNDAGQFGNTDVPESSVPVLVTGALAGKTVTSVSAGGYHACALTNGSAYCWGANSSGQVGMGGFSESAAPALVAGALAGKTVTEIDLGNAFTCAVADSRTYCWGANNYGQLGSFGPPESEVPVMVAGALEGKTASGIATGSGQACVIADGSAYCWGEGGAGQVGNGAGMDTLSPAKVSGILDGKTVTRVVAGDYHTVAMYR